MTKCDGLTGRWSQSLAVAMRRFNCMKQFRDFATLAPASCGSAPFRQTLTPRAMDYPKEHCKSVYDYSDKSVQHAGCAAIGYAVINLFTGLLAWIQYFLYHRPGTGGFISHDFVSQQYLQHTPFITAVAVVFSVIIAAASGVLAFGIFRRSRFAVVAMLVFVILLQLYTWFIAHSPAGTVVSIIVVAFLLRGARRMFQDYSEQKIEAEKA